MSNLTWADVKLGDVVEERSRLRGVVLRVSNNGIKRILLTNGCIVSRFSNSPPPLQFLGRFDELGCKLNIERGGFTIPDEVMNDEQSSQPMPAYDFDPGDFFENAVGAKFQRVIGGAWCPHPETGVPVFFNHKDLTDYGYYPNFETCHPCDPDFEIMRVDKDSAKPIREMKEGDEQTVKVKHIGRMKPTPLPDEVYDGMDDSAPEDDAVGELIEYVNNVYVKLLKPNKFDTEKLQSLATKARDQYERMKEEADALDVAYVVGRDHGRNEKPTIPQEVMECLSHLHIEVCGRGTINITHNDAAHQAIQAALHAIERCEVAKPHPLTQVRELVEWAVDAGHHFGEAARRELAEYDGEATNE